MRVTRSVRLVGVMTVGLGLTMLSGCSGADQQPAPKPTSAGPCDTSALAQHAGVAAGAVQAYVWKPFRAGALDQGATSRKAALALAAAAADRSAGELAAVTRVQGCRTSLSLSSAVATGKALSTSVGAQLRAGKVNPQALGGLNSAMTLMLQQAQEAGVTVRATPPARTELAAG